MGRRTSSRQQCKSFASLDYFPEVVQFSFNNGETEFKTKMGAFFSLVMFILVLAFGIKRWVEMVN